MNAKTIRVNKIELQYCNLRTKHALKQCEMSFKTIKNEQSKVQAQIQCQRTK